MMYRRDEILREHGVEPDDFLAYMKQSEVDNECGTDEYRETQPAKGLMMMAEEMGEWMDVSEEAHDLARLLAQWLSVWEAEGATWYAGADALRPLLEWIFDKRWARGHFSLYTDHVDSLESSIEYYLEDREEAKR